MQSKQNPRIKGSNDITQSENPIKKIKYCILIKFEL